MTKVIHIDELESLLKQGQEEIVVSTKLLEESVKAQKLADKYNYYYSSRLWSKYIVLIRGE